ncbi:MAG: AAA family ATPase [Bacteroidetes bacterium]|nr:AAA family ATPase [Bacteroidota bacterium]
MIKRLVVEKLYDRFDFDLHFNEDLNLLTGRNGSGKTTLMKLMWGMLSGRIGDVAMYPSVENLLLEVTEGTLFQGTKEKELRLFGHNLLSERKFVARADLSKNAKNIGYSIGDVQQILPGRVSQYLESARCSLYFPTFRRNEGGYEFLSVPQPVGQNPLADENLANMIRAASNGPREFHVFVNYSSTIDIEFIIASIQANIANQTQKLEKEQSDFVLQLTVNVEGDERAILQAIRSKQEETNAKVAELMKPLTKLSEMIAILFKGKGVQVSGNLTLGDNLEAIHSEHLSSGEKQMLSLLAYCSICKNTIIFIDEPELSLSVDWQRLLVPMLLDIPNGNQYFMATHSPMIYALYPDKDIFLDSDKGGN